MYVYIYVYIYTYFCIYIYAYLHLCIDSYIYIYTYVSIETCSGGEKYFSAPEAMTTLTLPIATRSFTLTAWVRDNGMALGSSQPLVRKPLTTNPSHSCWAWYYPAIFKFGAHDFHSVLLFHRVLHTHT